MHVSNKAGNINPSDAMQRAPNSEINKSNSGIAMANKTKVREKTKSIIINAKRVKDQMTAHNFAYM